ncbi:MAG: sugar transferase [Mogibacterium sp.]|nr:sugar transferase [Mogibacterium sp.]
MNKGKERTIYDKHIKRLMDIVFCVVAMLLLIPIFIICALLIYAEDGGSVIFKQKRVGINKSYFTAHKFRSMKKDTPDDIPTHLMKDNLKERLTGVGRFLRKYSLDELPQLYDILIGNMSLVGPRCALWNQEDLIAERDKYGANDIRPGLTGWAQINGRDDIDICEKAELDGYYAEQLRKSSISGLLMDTRCFLGTIVAVIRADGVAE